MKLQITLVLVCMLSSEAFGLQCYEGHSDTSRTYNDTVRNCSDQCASMTASTQNGTWVFKTCLPAEECSPMSLNMEGAKFIMNIKCCNTDLCNNQDIPAIPRQPPNGKQCYYCIGKNCTRPVNCEGDETYCIPAAPHFEMVVGCASKTFCDFKKYHWNFPRIHGEDICFQAILINSSVDVKMSLFLILVPLFSSILFN